MSTENPTAAELLTAVNAAILDLVSGNVQSVSINNRSWTYQDLSKLRDMRKQLQMEVREPSSTIRLGDVS